MTRRGPAPKPTAIRRLDGNPGGRAWNHDEPVPPSTLGEPATSIKFVTVYADKDGTPYRELAGVSLEAEHTLPALALDDEN